MHFELQNSTKAIRMDKSELEPHQICDAITGYIVAIDSEWVLFRSHATERFDLQRMDDIGDSGYTLLGWCDTIEVDGVFEYAPGRSKGIIIKGGADVTLPEIPVNHLFLIGRSYYWVIKCGFALRQSHASGWPTVVDWEQDNQYLGVDLGEITSVSFYYDTTEPERR